MQTFVLDETQYAQTIHLKESTEPFEIILDTNPSTGYDWEYTYDHGCLQLLLRTYDTSNLPPESVGGPAKLRMTFRTIGSTKSTVVLFDYMRPWEVNSVRSINLTISQPQV